MSETVTGIVATPSGTSTAWSATTLPLPLGVIVYESDTGRFKIGNGITLYTALSYAINTPASILIPGTVQLATAQQAQAQTDANVAITPASLTGYALLAAANFTGAPTAPTASFGTNTTTLATTAFVQTAIGALSGTGSTAAITLMTVFGGAVVLTSAQVKSPLILVEGILTSNTTLIMPTTGQWSVINRTTGAFSVTAKTATGTGIVITQGYSTSILADGTNIVHATDDLQYGVVISNATLTGNQFQFGTIDATPIGAAIPSTAVFTTLVVSGALSGSGISALLSPYATLASPVLTGMPTAPTAAFGTNTSMVATTAFVQYALANTPNRVTSLTTDGSLITNAATGAVTLALNPAHTTIWTTVQNFSEIVATGSVTMTGSLTIAGVTQIFPGSGVVAGLSDVQTLTQKTISGSLNTFSNIPTAALSTSTFTIGTTTIGLGQATPILTGFAPAVNNEDVITLGQVQSLLRSGVHVYTQAQALFTTNITTTNPGTLVDGSYTVQPGDIILLIGQSTPDQNGPWMYQTNTTTLIRPQNYPSGTTLTTNLVYTITGVGSNHGDWQYVLNTTNVTVDTTATSWGVFSAAITGGSNITVGGGVVSLITSPALTGLPTAATASSGTNTAQIATTAFVTAAINSFMTPGLAVTSLTDSDNSLVVSDTTGAVAIALNLAHSNAWTAAQSFTTLSASGAISLTGSISIAGVTQTFPGSGVVVGLSDVQTLTQKTISGSVNTFSNIPITALNSNAIVFGSTTVTLGQTLSVLNNISIGMTTAAQGIFSTLVTKTTLSVGGTSLPSSGIAIIGQSVAAVALVPNSMVVDSYNSGTAVTGRLTLFGPSTNTTAYGGFEIQQTTNAATTYVTTFAINPSGYVSIASGLFVGGLQTTSGGILTTNAPSAVAASTGMGWGLSGAFMVAYGPTSTSYASISLLQAHSDGTNQITGLLVDVNNNTTLSGTVLVQASAPTPLLLSGGTAGATITAAGSLNYHANTTQAFTINGNAALTLIGGGSYGINLSGGTAPSIQSSGNNLGLYGASGAAVVVGTNGSIGAMVSNTTGGGNYLTLTGSAGNPILGVSGGMLELTPNPYLVVTNTGVGGVVSTTVGGSTNQKNWGILAQTGTYGLVALDDALQTINQAYVITRGSGIDVLSHTWYVSSGGISSEVLHITATGVINPTIMGGSLNDVQIGNLAPGTGGFINLSASGVVSGAGFTALFADAPPIGSTTANTGAFTTLSASGAVSGTGFTTYLTTPPPIGSTTANSGSFTSLVASSNVSGTGFTGLFATPPAIGQSVANTGAFTTLSASGAVSGSGFSTLLSVYAPLASPVFTGLPTAPTIMAGDSSGSLATTQFVQTRLSTVLIIPIVDGSYTVLTPAQYNASVLIFTGALSTITEVQIPYTGVWLIFNYTTGSGTLFIMIPSHTFISIPQSFSRTITAYNGNIYGSIEALNYGPPISDSTITNSTLDSSPIGATTPSTAAFTTLSVSGAIGGTGIASLLNPYAFIASPQFTGVPLAPTATSGTNSNQIATTAFVSAATAASTGGSTVTSSSITTTGGALTLTTTEAHASVLFITGALTSNASFVVPNTGMWSISNNTSGNYTLTITTASGTGVVISQGYSATVLANGTNVVRTQTDLSYGAVIANATISAATLIDAILFTPALTSATLTNTNFLGSTNGITQPAGTNTTALATTAFVASTIGNYAGFSYQSTSPITLNETHYGTVVQIGINNAIVTLPSVYQAFGTITFIDNLVPGQSYTIQVPSGSGGEIFAAGLGVVANTTAITLQAGENLTVINRGTTEWDIIAGSYTVFNLQDATFSGSVTFTGAITTTAALTVSNSLTGNGVTALFASPPPLGLTIPNTAAITNLTVTGTVTGVGITTLFATPPALGTTTANSGSFTTLSASGSVAGSGFSAYLASPPAIGTTLANTGAFTSVTISGTLSGAGITTLFATPPPIGSTTTNSGSFTNLSALGGMIIGTPFPAVSTVSLSVEGVNATFGLKNTPDSLYTLLQATNNTLSFGFANTTAGTLDTIATNTIRAVFTLDATTGRVGTVTNTLPGTPVWRNLLDDGAGNSIIAGTLNVTGLLSGAGFTSLFATPSPIGSTTPNSGSFTTLSVSGTLGGAGVTALFASPPSLGATVPNSALFTTVAISGSLSGSAVSAYFASPPSIGQTTPNTGTFTTLSATALSITTAPSGSGIAALFANPPALGNIAPNTATVTTLTTTGSAMIGSVLSAAYLFATSPTTGGQWQSSGSHIGWDYAGLGEFALFSSNGSGTGGFNFYSVVSSSAATPTLLVAISSAGAITATSLSLSGSANVGNLTVNGTLSGTGLSTLFASPPGIGFTTPNSASFTTLAVAGAITGSGVISLLASPPAMGGTTPNAGSFTTLSVNGAISGNGVTTLLSSYAPLASPNFSGTPTTPNVATTSWALAIANTGFVQTRIASNISIPLTGGSLTLTSLQYPNSVIIFTGTLSSNATVIVPNTGNWIIANRTAGNYTMMVSTASGTGAFISQGYTQEIFADGTNIVYAMSDLSYGATISGATISNSSGAFTALSVSGAVTGFGFTALLEAPPAIGVTTPNRGSFTTLSITSTVSGSGITTLLSPYALLASPIFSGTPTAPTPSNGDTSLNLATTAFVQNRLASTVPITLAGGSLTLTNLQSNAQSLLLTGTLISAAILTVPLIGMWVVCNRTTGAYPVTVTTASGTGVTIDQNYNTIIIADGVNVVSAASDLTTGVLISGAVINATPVGATTPSTGQFTTLNVTTTLSGTGVSAYLASPPPIGITGANTGAFTALTVSGSLSGNAITTLLAAYAQSASPTLTGVPSAPTAAVNTNTTQLATTAFVQTQIAAIPVVVNITGNAGTATKLHTAVNINGMAFDGSASITIYDSTKEPIIVAGTTSQYWRGDKTWQPLSASALSDAATLATLTGTQALSNKTINASLNTLSNIPNTALISSSITVGSTTIALGSSISTLTGIAAAVNPSDVTILSQVQSLVASGVHTYTTVAALISTPISITTPSGLTDGTYVVQTGDIILLIAQTTGSQNGPWIYNGGSFALTRPSTYASGSTITSTPVYTVTGSGSSKQNWQYVLNTTNVTVDTTATSWGVFNTALSAGSNISLSGGIISLISSPTLYGTPTAPTANAITNSTQIATTAFVQTISATLLATVGSASAAGIGDLLLISQGGVQKSISFESLVNSIATILSTTLPATPGVMWDDNGLVSISQSSP